MKMLLGEGGRTGERTQTMSRNAFKHPVGPGDQSFPIEYT